MYQGAGGIFYLGPLIWEILPNICKNIDIIIIITFILIQEKGFTESLLNEKTSTGPNSAQLPFSHVITQTSETVNVNLELDYLHLLKTNFNNYT